MPESAKDADRTQHEPGDEIQVTMPGEVIESFPDGDYLVDIDGHEVLVPSQEIGVRPAEQGHVEVTKHDGHPALQLGDELLQLRTTIEVEDENADGPLGTRHLETTTEVDYDDHSWWNVFKDEEPGELEHPLVCIEPRLVE